MEKKKEELIPLSFMKNKKILKVSPKWATNGNIDGNKRRASSVFFEDLYVWNIVFRQYNNDPQMNSDLDVYIVRAFIFFSFIILFF